MSDRVTVSALYDKRVRREKIVAVSCYDFTTARLVARSGVDMILVGDSAAEVVLGYENTLPVTMDFMVTITAGAKRGAGNCCVVADMPFLSYHAGVESAVLNAGRFFAQAGVDMVKMEVSQNDVDVVRAVNNAGMAVMAHIGIRPQRIALEGRLRAEGTTADSAADILALAQAMVEAGAKALLIEGTAVETAKLVTERSPVPVIGCGSGLYCDGQVLIVTDILGLTEGPRPKFAKSFGSAGAESGSALSSYAREVRAGTYPDDEHSYHLKKGQIDRLNDLTKK